MIRILIADDHEVARYGLRKILERQPGCEVVAEAHNGKEAISKAIETGPDVAILDYAMPIINGIEATRRIRGRLPNTEVLILTAYDDDELLQECLRAGARSYLLKSTTERQLLSAIEFLAVHKPFLTGKIADTLLDSFLAGPISCICLIPTRHDAMARETLAATDRSVLQLAADGCTNEHIATRLKMNVKLVKELVNYAMRKGLIER